MYIIVIIQNLRTSEAKVSALDIRKKHMYLALCMISESTEKIL